MKESCKWALGMALYDAPPVFYESSRARWTAESILIHHPLVNEIIIIDNDPKANSPLPDLAKKSGGAITYYAMPEPKGTAVPRNTIFRLARHRRVAVVDPHVLLYPGFFEALNEVYDGMGPDCPDLLHGFLMTENPKQVYATHMNDQWRAKMWGTWGVAWQRDDLMVSCVKPNDQTEELWYVTVGNEGGQRPLLPAEMKEHSLPNIGWSGHEAKMMEMGFDIPTDPFLVPSHGMGFFACLRDKWLPFHPGCRGFGGEEMTTGYRYRREGRNCWTVPGAKWWHDFWRSGTTPYRLTDWDRVRNYYLEFKALDMDVEILKRYFVPRFMHGGEWAQVVSGMVWPSFPAAGVNGVVLTPAEAHAKQLAENKPVRTIRQ